MAVVISEILLGSTKIAAFPAISGMDVQLEVITGVPVANASVMGRPNPSYRLVKVNAVAACKRHRFSKSLT